MAFRLGRKKWLVLVIVIAIAAILATLVKFDPPVTISKETTYITEPLRSDGFPDYVAALNQRFSEGVTPENNSSVLFWKAMGPSAIEHNYRERFFQMLGVPPLPEKGDYFVTFDEHVIIHIDHQMVQAQPADNLLEEEIRERLWKQLDSAMKRPWSKQEFPEWAEWIATNEKPLALLVEASKRPRRYDPLIGKDVISLKLRGSQCSREVARALVARAMLRLNDGKPDKAWEDLLACHRLARLIGQGPTLIEAVVALTIDGMACNGDQALFEHSEPPSARIAEMREDLANLAPMPVMAEKIDVAERFICLDTITRMAREGPDAINMDDNGNPDENDEPIGAIASLEKSMRIASFDWDYMLRIQNEWYDRVVDACHKPTRAERDKAIGIIEEDLREESERTHNWKTMVLSLLTNSRQARSRLVGQVFLSLLLPTNAAAMAAEDRATMQLELNGLAFALAAYRADHGSYPAKLAELVPKYVKTVPKDLFNNIDDLHYTRQDNGYLLYSIGPNSTDNGGKSFDDRSREDWNSEDWDDMVVRIPSKP